MSNSADCSLQPPSRHLREVDEDEEGDVGEMVYVSVHVYLRVKGRGTYIGRGYIYIFKGLPHTLILPNRQKFFKTIKKKNSKINYDGMTYKSF